MLCRLLATLRVAILLGSPVGWGDLQAQPRSWVSFAGPFGASVSAWRPSLSVDPRSDAVSQKKILLATTGGLYLTNNLGDSWFPASSGILPDDQLTEFIVRDPSDPDTVYVAVRNP